MNTSTLKTTINIPSLQSSPAPAGFPDYFWSPHPDSMKLLTPSPASEACVVGVHLMPSGLTASQLCGLVLNLSEGVDVDFDQLTKLTFGQMLYLLQNHITVSAQLSLLLMRGIDGPQIGWFQRNGPKWVVYSYDPDSGFEFPLPSELYVIRG